MDTYSYAATLPLVEPVTQALWAISGDDPEKVSATQVAQRMNIRMTQPHLVWNPHDGELIEMIPATHENRFLYSVRKMLAILVVANDTIMFTDYPDRHLAELLTRIPESIPNDWPMGPPSTLNLVANNKPLLAAGHYTADQVSQVGRKVGPIDIKRLRRQA